MMDAKIENIVATTTIGKEINLEKIATTISGTKYEKERFPGLIMHIDEPKTTYLLFRSGRVVSLGAKSVEELPIGVQKLCEKLRSAGLEASSESEIAIKNVVASSDLRAEVNLTNMALALGLEKVEYEPEQFPGLVYWLEEPHAVFLIFNSGKIICLGTKSPEQASEAINTLSSKLDSLKLI
jgi:transcription initiation factor TFIID TATA-box-binding protein